MNYKKRLIYIVSAILIVALTACAGNVTETPQDVVDLPETTLVPTPDTTSEVQNTPAIERRVYTPPEMKGEITINTYMDLSDLLKNAAAMFMNKYPEVTVTVNVYMEQLNSVTTSDGSVTVGIPEDFSVESYLLMTNTEIMSGKADDIYLTGQIPIKKYTDMDVFEDLSFYLENSPEISDENYYTRIIDFKCDSEGQIFEIPYIIGGLQIVGLNKKIAEHTGIYIDDSITSMSYKDLLEYCKSQYNASTLVNTFFENGAPSMGLDPYLFMIWDNYEKYVDINNYKTYFDTPDFIELLKSVTALETQYTYVPEGFDFYNSEYYLPVTGPSSVVVDNAINSIVSDDPYHYVLLSDENSEVKILGYSNLSINSKSTKKELAWEFIKFILSDEIQTLPSMSGLGINKKGFEAHIEKYCRNINSYYDLDISVEQVKEIVEDWYSQATGFVTRDQTIHLIIEDELRKYAQLGEQTAEETAREIQRRADMYFNQ